MATKKIKAQLEDFPEETGLAHPAGYGMSEGVTLAKNNSIKCSVINRAHPHFKDNRLILCAAPMQDRYKMSERSGFHFLDKLEDIFHLYLFISETAFNNYIRASFEDFNDRANVYSNLAGLTYPVKMYNGHRLGIPKIVIRKCALQSAELSLKGGRYFIRLDIARGWTWGKQA